jgi:malonyl-CoA O-methyltransferase
LHENCDLLLVDLPGFGDSSVFESVDAFIEQLLVQLPQRFMLLGWSLGGMLATRLAALQPQRVSALITLAANLSFVQRDNWTAAMAADTFSEFCGSFSSAPEMTLKRFSGLMSQGDKNARPLLKSLREATQSSWQHSSNQWQLPLQWLGELDNIKSFSTLAMAGLHLLGREDALVPCGAAEGMQSLNLRQQVSVLAGSGHAPHCSDAEQVWQRIEDFLQSVHYAVDKQKVADSFGKAAHNYDSVAAVQRQIGHRMMEQVQSCDGLALDLGCGTGYFTPLLGEKFSCVAGLDLAQGMLSYARETRSGDYLWLCGDAENLPLADHSVSAVFSSLAIQWCADLPALFSELKRVIRPGGKLYLATLGPDTLKELRQAWSNVDNYTHVNTFASKEKLREAISASGLTLDRFHGEDIVLQYDEVRQLTYELKTLGAHNMNHGQSAGLTGRQRVIKFKQAYEQFRNERQKLPATYQAYYLELSC